MYAGFSDLLHLRELFFHYLPSVSIININTEPKEFTFIFKTFMNMMNVEIWLRYICTCCISHVSCVFFYVYATVILALTFMHNETCIIRPPLLQMKSGLLRKVGLPTLVRIHIKCCLVWSFVTGWSFQRGGL